MRGWVVIKCGFIPEHTVVAALMERHLSAQLIYPHHVSKWVVLVMARVMAYLTARVLVIRSFVRQAACTACWVFLQRHSSEGKHLTFRSFKSRTTPRRKLEIWTFQACLAPEVGVARGNLLLSVASNKKESSFQMKFHCRQVADIYFYVCQKTETE